MTRTTQLSKKSDNPGYILKWSLKKHWMLWLNWLSWGSPEDRKTKSYPWIVCVANKPLLRKNNDKKRRRKRKEAKKYKEWTLDQWTCALRRRKSKWIASTCWVPTVKHGGGGGMLWGCFAGIQNSSIHLHFVATRNHIWLELHQWTLTPNIPLSRKRAIWARRSVMECCNSWPGLHNHRHCIHYTLSSKQSTPSTIVYS